MWSWLFLLWIVATPAAAQDLPGPSEDRINLFFDCQTGGCRDFDSFRREIPFVNWMRDREDADVHVLVTSQGTGGGGRFYRMAFLVLRNGLGDDPWDFWVSRIDANGNGQTTSSFLNWSSGLSANRMTEAWKISVSGRFFMNVQSFDFTDADGVTQTVEERREDWSTSTSVVRSVGEQWAVGLRGDASSSTLLNQDLTLSVQPGVEYNFFPYSEPSRKSFTLQYLVGPAHFRYAERTIFGQTDETRFQESLTARLSLIEPWDRWYDRGARCPLSARRREVEPDPLRQRRPTSLPRLLDQRLGELLLDPRFGGRGGGGDVIFFF